MNEQSVCQQIVFRLYVLAINCLSKMFPGGELNSSQLPSFIFSLMK
jgi:hypothetical protein